MTATTTSHRPASRVGTLLQYWRGVRGMSQLALAIEADVSARHVSFIETGRAQPSREMVLLLASALDVPLRERNALLLAAGYAPMFHESPLDAPEVRAARRAIDAILAKQEPFPAVVMNRHWDIVFSNAAAGRFFGMLRDHAPMPAVPNVMRLMFDPAELRPHVVNWEDVAGSLIRRLHREATGGVLDAGLAALLEEVSSFPGVPRGVAHAGAAAPDVPLIPVTFAKQGRTYNVFSAITTLGTPQDVTLQELRIESFFPLDDESARNLEALQQA